MGESTSGVTRPTVPAAVLFSEVWYHGDPLVCLGEARALPEGACRSMRVRPGTVVILFEKPSFEGRSQLVAADLPDLFLAGGSGVAWGADSGPGSLRVVVSGARVHAGRWALTSGGRYLARKGAGLGPVGGPASAGLFRLAREFDGEGRALLQVEDGDAAPGEGALLRGLLDGDESGPFTLRDPGSGRLFGDVGGVLAPVDDVARAAVLTAPVMVAAGESEIGRLSSGEAALFAHPNFRGPALLVRGDLDRLVGVAGWLGREAAAGEGVAPRSVLLGPATGLTLSPGEAQEGQELEIDVSVPMLELAGFPEGVRSAHSWRNLDAAVAGVRFTYALGQDFRQGAVGGALEETTVYRANIGLAPGVGKLDLWADSEVDVVIAGVSCTLDPEVPLSCSPNPIGRLTVSIEPTGLSAPTLWLRTPGMGAEERVVICADRSLHERLAGLDDRALYEAKGDDGEFLVGREHSAREAAAVQHAVSQAMRLVTPGAGGQAAPHATTVQASGMDHRNWVLELGERPGFRELDEASAIEMAGTDVDPGDLAQGLFDDIGKAAGRGASEVSRVIVQTARPVGKPVAAFVGGAGKAVEGVGKQVGNVAADVVGGIGQVSGEVAGGIGDVAGDVVGGIGKAVGGLGDVAADVGRVVVDTGGHVIDRTGRVVRVIGNLADGVADRGGDVAGIVRAAVGELLEDVGEFVVVTFQFAGERKPAQFLVKTARDAAKLAETIYEQIGVGWNKVVGWLRETFSFLDIGRLHEAIEAKFVAPMLETGAGAIESFRPQMGSLFDALEEQLTSFFGEPTEGPGPGLPLKGPEMPGILSRAIDAVMEKIDWLINKVFEGLDQAFEWRFPALPDIGASPAAQRLADILASSSLGRAAHEVGAELVTAFRTIDPTAPSAFFQAVKSTMARLLMEGLKALRAAADVVVELLLEFWEAIKTVVTDPDTGRIEIPFLSDFYRLVTGASTLTLSRLISFVLALPATIVDALTPLNVAAGRGVARSIVAKDDQASGTGPDPVLFMYGMSTIVKAAMLMIADLKINPTRLDEQRRLSTASDTSNAEWQTPLRRRLEQFGQFVLIAFDACREWLGTGFDAARGGAPNAVLEKAIVGLAWSSIALDLVLLPWKGATKRFIEEVGPCADMAFDATSTAATLALPLVGGETRGWDVAEGVVLTLGHAGRIPLKAYRPLGPQVQRGVLQADLALGALGSAMVVQSLAGHPSA